MKKRLVKILTIAICMVSIFTVSASAYTTEQPPQDYLPLLMQDTGTIMWQMPPYDVFAIATSTFPENFTYDDLDNLVIASMQSYYVIWADVHESGSAETLVYYYGELYTADEPSGFHIKPYDWLVDEEEGYIYINFGIYDIGTSTWAYNPYLYRNVDTGNTVVSKTPAVFYSADTTTAGDTYNRELGYWALSHFPIANTYWEEQENPIYNIGYRDGKANAERAIFNEGKTAGYNEAMIIEYNRGFNAGLQQGDDATFASLIFAVIDTPISVLTKTLDFNILGTNMASFVYQMISALLFLIIVKVIIKVLI